MRDKEKNVFKLVQTKSGSFSIMKDGINAGSYNLNSNELNAVGLDKINEELKKFDNKDNVESVKNLINSLKENSMGLNLNDEFDEEEISDLEGLKLFKKIFDNEYFKEGYTFTALKKDVLNVISKIKKDENLKKLLLKYFRETNWTNRENELEIIINDSYQDNLEERLKIINDRIGSINYYFYYKLDQKIYEKEKIPKIEIKDICEYCGEEECECEECENCGATNSFSHCHYEKIATCQKCGYQHSI